MIKILEVEPTLFPIHHWRSNPNYFLISKKYFSHKQYVHINHKIYMFLIMLYPNFYVLKPSTFKKFTSSVLVAIVAWEIINHIYLIHSLYIKLEQNIIILDMMKNDNAYPSSLKSTKHVDLRDRSNKLVFRMVRFWSWTL